MSSDFVLIQLFGIYSKKHVQCVVWLAAAGIPVASLEELTVISILYKLFENKCYNVTWELTTALSTAGYLAAETLVALVI